jgi:hypothetical protein
VELVELVELVVVELVVVVLAVLAVLAVVLVVLVLHLDVLLPNVIVPLDIPHFSLLLYSLLHLVPLHDLFLLHLQLLVFGIGNHSFP